MIIGIAGKLQSGKDLVGHIIQYLHDKSVYKISTPDTVEDFNRYMENGHDIRSFVKIKKFATAPKHIISIMTGVNSSDFESDEFKNSEMSEEWWYWEDKNGNRISYLPNKDLGVGNLKYKLHRYTYRKFIQEFATDAIRNVIHPDAWVNVLFFDYNPTSRWVITDVRFPNEIDSIVSRGGIVIKVTAPEFYYLNSKTNSIEKRRVLVDEEGLFPMKENDELVQLSKYFHTSETAIDNYDNFSYIIDNYGGITELISKVKEILQTEKIIKND
jgi:hypothetical protein